VLFLIKPRHHIGFLLLLESYLVGFFLYYSYVRYVQLYDSRSHILISETGKICAVKRRRDSNLPISLPVRFVLKSKVLGNTRP